MVTGEVFRTLFLRTIMIAAIVSAIVLVLAYPFAYIATFVFPSRSQLLYFLVLVSLFGGYLVRIYAWRTILGREGLINETLLTSRPASSTSRSAFSSTASSPSSSRWSTSCCRSRVLPIYCAMQNVSPGLLEAGRDLGSSRLARDRAASCCR